MHILGEMGKAITRHRAELGEHAPRIEVIHDPGRQDPRGDRLGRQGDPRDRGEDRRQDRHLRRRHRQGRLGQRPKSIKAAINWIKSIASEPEVGQIYEGTVVKVMDFGAFVNFFGAKDGLVHISQLGAAPGAEDRPTSSRKATR